MQPPFVSGSATAIVATCLASHRAAARGLPTPRLVPVPALGQSLLAVAVLDSTRHSTGLPHKLVVVGPLVTYGALRDGFWGQRLSLGLFAQWAAVDEPELAGPLRAIWGVEPVPANIRIDAGGGREARVAVSCVGGNGASPDLELQARPLVGASLSSVREVFVYSRRGSRLLNSRCAMSGGALAAGPALRGRLALDAGLLRAAHLPTPVGPVLGAALASEVELTLHGPGREYDL